MIIWHCREGQQYQREIQILTSVRQVWSLYQHPLPAPPPPPTSTLVQHSSLGDSLISCSDIISVPVGFHLSLPRQCIPGLAILCGRMACHNYKNPNLVPQTPHVHAALPLSSYRGRRGGREGEGGHKHVVVLYRLCNMGNNARDMGAWCWQGAHVC